MAVSFSDIEQRVPHSTKTAYDAKKNKYVFHKYTFTVDKTGKSCKKYYVWVLYNAQKKNSNGFYTRMSPNYTTAEELVENLNKGKKPKHYYKNSQSLEKAYSKVTVKQLREAKNAKTGTSSDLKVEKLGKYTVHGRWVDAGNTKKNDSLMPKLTGKIGNVILESNFAEQCKNFMFAAQKDGLTKITWKKDGRGQCKPTECESWAGAFKGSSKLWVNGLALQLSADMPMDIQSKERKWIKAHQGDYGLDSFPMDTQSKTLLVLCPASVTAGTVGKDSDGKFNIKYDGKKIKDNSGGVVDNSNNSDTASTDGDAAAAQETGSVNSTAYFFANQFATVQNEAASMQLIGERAVANDETLWGAVKTAVESSLRSCSSDGAGRFVAWYPDYFGKHGNDVVMTLKQIELTNLTIEQNESSFYSHVFTPGVDVAGAALDKGNLQYLATQGCVSIESHSSAQTAAAIGKATGDTKNAASDQVSDLIAELINIPKGQEWKYSPRELYRKYGARPYQGSTCGSMSKIIEQAYEWEGANSLNSTSTPANATGNPSNKNKKSKKKKNEGNDDKDTKETEDATGTPTYILPFLYALYTFMDLWSKQYTVTIGTTFNPEIFPGMRLRIEGFDLEVYVEKVQHTMGYSGGFSTSFTSRAPKGTIVEALPK